MIQFYAPSIVQNPVLGAEEALHCVRVLRKRSGDIIYATDGKGKRYECRINEASTREVKLEILAEETVQKGWNYRLCLAVAPTKNADRMAWLVEKATEIGVDEIIFIRCRYSERKEVNIERLRRNAISAMNQSLKTLLPEINGVEDLKSILNREGEKFFGYCSPEIPKVDFVKEYSPGNNVIIAIGPEGDFSSEEVENLMQAGFMPVTFGSQRLRTETAALFGVTATHIVNDLNAKK